MAEQIHYGLQRTVGGLRSGHIEVFQWIEAAAIIVEWVKSAGRQVAGKRFLEVGTGRQPIVPAALWLCGAAQTLTVDLNRQLSEGVIAESLRYLRENRDEVWQLFGEEAERPGFEDRFRRLTDFSGRSPELLRLINATYIRS